MVQEWFLRSLAGIRRKKADISYWELATGTKGAGRTARHPRCEGTVLDESAVACLGVAITVVTGVL